MRFFRAEESFEMGIYRKTMVQKGRVVCFSNYFTWTVLVSDGDEKTKFLYGGSYGALELFIEGKLVPLTEKELNKIKPHLRKEHFGRDLEEQWDYTKQFNFRHK